MQDVDRRSWLIPATASLALMPAAASASGFALLEQSASRLGTAFAGTAAAADDATTVFFNPAGMTSLRRARSRRERQRHRDRFGVSQRQLRRRRSHSRSAATAATRAIWNFVPAAYFVLPVGDDLAFGIGVNAPFGLKLVYDDGWIGRFQALHSEIKTLNVNPSVAWRIGERISLGAGIDYQRLDAELTNDVNYSAVVAQGVQQLVATGQLPPATGAAVDRCERRARGRRARARRRRRVGIQRRSAVRSVGPHASRPLVSIVDRVHRGRHDRLSRRRPAPIRSRTASLPQPRRPGAPLSSGAVKVALELPDSATLSLQHRLRGEVRVAR